VEFGHSVLLVQTKEKFISDYDVYEHKPADCVIRLGFFETSRLGLNEIA
jgi:hypothetical protein